LSGHVIQTFRVRGAKRFSRVYRFKAVRTVSF
jgi:hypothetical protein